MKRYSKFSKRFLAVICVLAMLVSSLGPGIQVAARSGGTGRKQMERDMEAAIREALKKEDPAIKKDHPKGIFSFATLTGEVNEENKDPLAVYLVRHGGTKGEQKVQIKFSDYSAEYGKDYYAKLDDSIFAEKVEANPDSVPLFYMFENGTSGDGEQTAIDEESVIKAYGEERGKRIIELTKEYSAAEAKAQEKADAEETQTEEKTSDAGQEKSSSPLDELIDETSQYRDSGYSLTMEGLLADDERNENTAAYGANMLDTIFPGAETELVFEDGEIMKKIYVYPIDNEVSDGDRVFNIQINGGSEDLAWQQGENSSTVTIIDDEEDETSYISIKDCPTSVGVDGKASVTLQRKGGLYNVSTVEFIVTAAKKELAKGTAIFMPNMTERTVEFSVSGVNAKTVDSISFALKDPAGARLSGSQDRRIGLTELKVRKYATAHTKDVDENESPIGLAGTLSVNGIDLDLGKSFVEDERADCKSMEFSASQSEMKIFIPCHGAPCKGARIGATLKKKLNQEAVESVYIELDRYDGSTTCNRMYVAKQSKANGAEYKDWDGSRDLVMAAKGDQDRGEMNKGTVPAINFRDGSVKNVSHLAGYENDYMKYEEGTDNPYTYFTILAKKTSGGFTGMDLTVYGVRVNFRNYTIDIRSADDLEGHEGDTPGELYLAKTETPGQNNTDKETSGTRYAYEKVNFTYSADSYAYLDHLQFADGTAIDAKYYQIGGKSVTLDMNDAFFNQYQKQIDSTNNKITIKPVFAKKSVKLTINTSKHGGIEVEGVKYSRNTNNKEITIHVGDKLKVKPYDVEPDYHFSSYEMIATGLNGMGDSKKISYPAEEPDNMDIENYNYTIEPVYTADGTSVVVKADTIPAGCSIDKTEWTYKKDRIRARQILEIKAKPGEDYRAKWTITSNTHEWYNKTFYGDTLYHKVGGPTDEITLEFEKCTDMQYVSVNGKALVQEATIRKPPFLNVKGIYDGNYIPAANASIQMGEFSSLTKQDGSYTLYSHTESEETSGQQNNPSGTNTTTYLKAGPNETRTVKVIHNGLAQVYYMQITGNLTGVHSSQSSPYMVANIPALELDFFGEGPTPKSIDALVGTVDKDDYPKEVVKDDAVEMHNYSVGFQLTLADVLDENGKDLIDKVNFYVYNKNNVFKSMYTVERTRRGQTDYLLDRYLVQDDEGKVGYMKLNGLMDFADQDKVYVELVGTMKDANGNKVEDADMSYGLYNTGIFFQEKLEITEIQLKDVAPSNLDPGNGGVPIVDVLGQMLPTLKLGKLGISAVRSGNMMEFSVGFDVMKLNKSIYDSYDAENAEKAQNLKTQMDEEEASKESKQKELDGKNEELQEIWNNPDPSDADIERSEQLNKEMDALEGEIKTINDSIQAKQEEYDSLTASPKKADPLEPAKADSDDKANDLNVTKKVTAEEITNVTEVTKPELNPVDKNGLWKGMKERLKQEAQKSGMTKPKSDSLQGHGTVSANLGIDLGVTVRLSLKVLEEGGEGKWCFDKALVYARVQGGISAMYYFIIPNFPIPMYAGANFTASVGAYAGMGCEQLVTTDEMGKEEYDGSDLYFSGDIPVTLGIEGFVGMGLKSLLAVELGIGFLQKFDFAYAYDGEQIGTGMSSFYGYVQTNVLFFSFKWKFAQVNWKYVLYDKPGDAEEKVKKLMRDSGLGSDVPLSEFTVENTPKVHYYGGAKARRLSKRLGYANNGSTILGEGITRTVSDVVSLGGGKYLMAFEGERLEGDCPNDMKPGSDDYAYNSRAIYLSYYNGTQWSEKPVILQKDDTLDTGLQVEDMGDDILISWSSADERFKKGDITTGNVTEDGQEIKEDAAVKVLSSLDVYAAVLKKEEVAGFVSGTADKRKEKIVRLTEDKKLTDEQKSVIKEQLADGAEYLGYGHQNGQAVSVGDQIYLFYDTIDYNHWKGGKKPENLSDIVDAKGYILYRIYDKKTGKWLENYADSKDKEVYEKLGFTMGQRMADIHLNISGSDKKLLPVVSQMDVQAVKVKGEDRVAVTYMIDSDGTLANINSDGDGEESINDQALFIAFMKPAEISDGGNVTVEAKWSEPLQMNTELSHISDPQMVQTKKDGKDTVYLVWADSKRLMFSNLTQLFQKIEAEKDEVSSGKPEDNLEEGVEPNVDYTPIEVSEETLKNGNKVEVYKMKKGIEPKIAILGDEENGFQYNNGYRLAADDAGHIYAVWAQSSGSSQGLYLSAMSMPDNETGSETWSKPRLLDWDEEKKVGKYLTNPSIAVDSDGTIVLGHNAYNLKNNLSKDEDGHDRVDTREHVDDTFCATIEKAIGTPILEDAELSNDYPRAGEEFTVSAVTGNDGLIAADKINVKAELVQTRDGAEAVLETKTQSFTNVGSGHRDEVRIPFTMKQEYLDAAKSDGVTYQIRLTASEQKADKDYAETASAAVDIKTGAHYTFTNESVKGHRCRDIKRDSEAGTIQFGRETGENRYMYSATVINDGNLPAEDMKVAMFASNENAFTSTRDKSGKNGTYEGTSEDLAKYYEKHSASESVANNEEFSNWIKLKSFLPGDTKGLGVGESAELNVLTAKIPDSMYSELEGMDLMLAVYDNAAMKNVATKNEGLSVQPVSIVKEEEAKLSLLSEGKKAGNRTMKPGEKASLTAMVLPLKAAADYSVFWESSNPEVAAVNDGEVTAIKRGTATIKASLQKDGRETMSRSVNITVGNTSGSQISPGDITSAPIISPIPTVSPSAAPTPSGNDATSVPSATQPSQDNDVTNTPIVSSTPTATQTPQGDVKKQVKVTFKGNKGKVRGGSQKTFTIGKKYGKLPKAVRKGYAFKGWYTKKSGGQKVTEDTKVTNKSAHSLYARWKKVETGRAQIQKLTVTKGKKMKITVKPMKAVDGYQICYSPKKKFSKKNTKKISAKKTAVTLKKIKRNKALFVKARAYKLDSAGKKVYGKYSKVKKKKL